MRKLITLIMMLLLATVCFSSVSNADGKVVYDFEIDEQGFELPDWTLEQDDMVCDSIEVSSDYVSEGEKSLKCNVAFPGGIWTAALQNVWKILIGLHIHKFLLMFIFQVMHLKE